LTVFRVREELQRQYEMEQEGVGRKGFAGRRLLDIGTVREVLRLRGQGVQGSVIEGRLGLGSGTVERIGAEGVVDVIR
jgi:hypothetical protein